LLYNREADVQNFCEAGILLEEILNTLISLELLIIHILETEVFLVFINSSSSLNIKQSYAPTD
jgi:hypothetical protein